MVNESLEGKSKFSIGKKARNLFFTAALGTALIAGPTACGTDNGKGNGKSTEKKEFVAQTSDDAQINSAVFQQDETSGPGLEPDLDSQGYEIVDTEINQDEYGRTMIKTTYKDGSWSTELEGGSIRYDYDEGRDYSNYDYTKFYPNGIKNFECSAAPYEGSLYAIYDENGKVLYYELFEGLRENDSANEDEVFKYDGKGRLIQDDIHGCEYKYDDANKKVVEIEKFYINGKTVVKHVITYKMDEYGEADYDNVLSHIFIGETGVEVDLMNGGVEKLIEKKHLENTPYIDRYKF